MELCTATATSPGELHAPAKSESAKVNRNPPWAVRCPLHISGVMVKVPSQRPRDKEVMVMPRFAVARSSANMVRTWANCSSSATPGAKILRMLCSLCGKILRSHAETRGLKGVVVESVHPDCPFGLFSAVASAYRHIRGRELSEVKFLCLNVRREPSSESYPLSQPWTPRLFPR